MRSPFLHRSALAVLSLLLVAAALAGCRSSSDEGVPTFVPQPTRTPSPGTTVEVERGSVVAAVETRGRISAERQALLSFPAAGVLETLHVVRGDEVEEGQLLAELDGDELEEALLSREQEVADAELALERLQTSGAYQNELASLRLALAQAQYEQTVLKGQIAVQEAQRKAEMGECGGYCGTDIQWAQSQADIANRIAEIQVSLARSSAGQTATSNADAVEDAEQQLEQAQARYLQATEALSETRLLAPFAGTIVSVDKVIGDKVEEGDALLTLADPEVLVVIAPILEEEIQRVAVGQSAVVRLDLYSGQPFTATVVAIADQPTGWLGRSAYEVTLDFAEGQELPASIGMGSDVLIRGERREGVLVVPSAAVLSILDETYVEVVGPDGDVERVTVQTGVTDGDRVEILSGLQEGQTLRIP